MMGKRMRILIADKIHMHRYSIEKMLNTLGFFRIAVAASSAETLKLTCVPDCPVSLVIMEDSLVSNSCLRDHTLHSSTANPPFILRYRGNPDASSSPAWENTSTGIPDIDLLSSVIYGIQLADGVVSQTNPLIDNIFRGYGCRYSDHRPAR